MLSLNETAQPDDSGTKAHTSAVLDVQHLRVQYPLSRGQRRAGAELRPAANDVSLTVGRAEIVGLVGESGSGKSTVAMAIMGLVRTKQGSVKLEGTEIIGLRGRALRRARLGFQMVFQDPYSSLDPRQRIRSGFREIRRHHRERTQWASDEEILALVQLDASALRKYPHQLSGGQIQRVVIARSLLLQPKLVIADEPTSALDVSVQAQILGLIDDLRKSLGLSVLFISHDLGVVRHITSRLYVMRSGEIVESGNTHDVMTNPHDPYTARLLQAMPGSSLSGRGGSVVDNSRQASP